MGVPLITEIRPLDALFLLTDEEGERGVVPFIALISETAYTIRS